MSGPPAPSARAAAQLGSPPNPAWSVGWDAALRAGPRRPSPRTRPRHGPHFHTARRDSSLGPRELPTLSHTQPVHAHLGTLTHTHACTPRWPPHHRSHLALTCNRRTPTDFTHSDSINLQNCHPAGDTADTTFTHSAAHVPIHVFTQTHTCESPDPKRQDVFSHTNSAQALPVHTQADVICSRTCWPVFFTFSPALTTAPYSGH